MSLSFRAVSRLFRFALFGLALWFFGNLYEEVVLMPNWVAASLDTLRAYTRYFAVVIQYHYYVPITQLAVLVLLVLAYRFELHPLRPALRRAGWWGLAGVALTVPIVVFLNTQLFLGDLSLTEADAHRLGWYWLGGNLLRLGCVGASLGYALRAYTQHQANGDEFLRNSTQ